MYVCVFVWVRVYIHVQRGRERERERETSVYICRQYKGMDVHSILAPRPPTPGLTALPYTPLDVGSRTLGFRGSIHHMDT